MGGQRVSSEFTLSSFNGPPGIRLPEGVADLGENFVRAFYFDTDCKIWRFYDPDVPESDLRYLVTGEPSWILVKEPVAVVLNRQTRNLSCNSQGNCWNLIVW